MRMTTISTDFALEPSLLTKLRRLGIKTTLDLLHYYPREHTIYRRCAIANLKPEAHVIVIIEAYDRYQAKFPNHTVGLLHGRMNGEEKQSVIAQFRNHQTQILVSTTVIEVGIDVPNATVIIIEHAERFGLSQLHQLQG
jgi:ATP-dependent DNA helicase RecG